MTEMVLIHKEGGGGGGGGKFIHDSDISLAKSSTSPN